MSMAAFDSIGYMRKLEEAGVPRQQAETQADALRQVLGQYDEASRREMATKGDIKDLRLEIEKVRGEIKSSELRLIKWQLGIGFAVIVIMAKGFGWLGF